MKKPFYLLAATLLLTRPVLAQTAPPAYEFLLMVETESQYAPTAKILFAPAFQGQKELPLAELPVGRGKISAVHQQNLEVVAQQLAAVTAAGWELMQATPTTTNGFENGQLYLFRRRKP